MQTPITIPARRRKMTTCHFDPMEKNCFRCGVLKPLDAFYKHPEMADGTLNKCKSCTKIDVRAHYQNNRKRFSDYDTRREQTPERKKAKRINLSRYRAKNRLVVRAYSATARAVRSGRIKRMPCIVCGGLKAEAHHHDYSRPLDVTWLCFKHHREVAHGQTVSK